MSDYFEWDRARFSVKVPHMDLGHQTIIACMNRLYTLNQDKAPAAQLAKAVDELMQVTDKHFCEEESYMATIGFPGLREHKYIHKNLLAQVMDHKLRFEASGVLSNEFFAFLKVWLKAHLCGIDMKYGQHRKTA